MPFPTDIQCIEAAETTLGVSLPSGWRARLLSSNGGVLFVGEDDWTVFPVFDASDKKRASRSSNHIVRENQSAREWPSFPLHAIAVAANGIGDYLVFLPSEPSSPSLSERLFLWSHETGATCVVAENTAGL